MKPIPTGVAGLDEILGGFQRGDNIIVENGVAAPSYGFLLAMARGAIRRGEHLHYVSVDASPATVGARLASLQPNVTLIDCFSSGLGPRRGPLAAAPGLHTIHVEDPQFPDSLHETLDSLPANKPRFIIVESLNGLALLWHSEQRAAEFYARTCPALFDAGDLAAWVLHSGIQSPAFHAQIGHIAQVVLTLEAPGGKPTMAVTRAVDRTHAGTSGRFAYQDGESFRITP